MNNFCAPNIVLCVRVWITYPNVFNCVPLNFISASWLILNFDLLPTQLVKTPNFGVALKNSRCKIYEKYLAKMRKHNICGCQSLVTICIGKDRKMFSVCIQDLKFRTMWSVLINFSHAKRKAIFSFCWANRISVFKPLLQLTVTSKLFLRRN